MLLKRFHIIACIVAFSLYVAPVQAVNFSSLSQQEQLRIADLIYNNECNRQYDCLVSWNDGENFASLGIGHFIWFPKNSTAPFQESFPDLLRWYARQHIQVPLGLHAQSPSLWNSKQAFLRPEHQADIAVLRSFLAQTKAIQAAFIMSRVKQALPKMLQKLSVPKQKIHIIQQFEQMTSSAQGWYVLTDYVNFKGEGIKDTERYNKQGWGLLQVLLKMNIKPDQAQTKNQETIEAFVLAAQHILQQRVENSPKLRNEQRWLRGWNKRLHSYLQY